MPPRVVSLLPSATEIVAALGIEPVATSHECDYPPSVADTPSVVESRIDADASSAEIDSQVQTADAEGGVYRIDHEALAAADPDVVISQGICEVCAVDTVVVESAIEELGLDCRLVTTDPHSLGDILSDIERIGDALDRTDRAAELVADLRDRIDRVATTTAESPIEPTVAVLDWLAPPMVAGHWVPELVDLAGGDYGQADPGDASTPREWASIREYDPDTLTEDYDVTIQLLKRGYEIRASPAATYTEVPATWRDLYRQRLRWYRGNCQTLVKHADVLVSPEYGYLHSVVFPLHMVSMVTGPFVTVLVGLSIAWSLYVGTVGTLVVIATAFLCLGLLVAVLSVQWAGERLRTAVLSFSLGSVYKLVNDAAKLKALLDVLFRSDITWTSPRRVRQIDTEHSD